MPDTQQKVYGGISLYLQGTQNIARNKTKKARYIPVPTGNSFTAENVRYRGAVYPCTYRELIYGNASNMIIHGISLYLQGTHLI